MESMIVTIKKDGYVYLDGSRSSAADILKLLRTCFNEFISEVIAADWLDNNDDDNTYVRCFIGSREFIIPEPMSMYIEGFSSVSEWKAFVMATIAKVDDWFMRIPVDEEEVSFNYITIL